MAGLMAGAVDGWLGVRLNQVGPGTVGASVRTITFAASPYTVLDSDWFIKMDCTGGIVIANLPTAVGRSGKEYIFKKIDATANVGRVEPAGAETIDGVLNADLLGQWDFTRIVSDGTNWMGA